MTELERYIDGLYLRRETMFLSVGTWDDEVDRTVASLREMAREREEEYDMFTDDDSPAEAEDDPFTPDFTP